MIEMIKRLIRSFKREKNWKERTTDAPKTFPVLQESLIEKVSSMESHAELIDGNIVITEKTSPAHNIAVHKIANALMSFKDNRNLDFEVFTDNVALYCNELHGDDKNFFYQMLWLFVTERVFEKTEFMLFLHLLQRSHLKKANLWISIKKCMFT